MQRLNGAIGDIAKIGLSHPTVTQISNSNRDWRCPASTKALLVKASGAWSVGDHTYTYDTGGRDGTRSDRTDRGRSESGTRFAGAGFDIRALGGKEGGRSNGGTLLRNQGANGDMVSLHQAGKIVALWCLTERPTSAIKLLQLGQALADVEGMMP